MAPPVSVLPSLLFRVGLLFSEAMPLLAEIMMVESLQETEQKALAELKHAGDSTALKEWRSRNLGKGSAVMQALGNLGNLPATERPATKAPIISFLSMRKPHSSNSTAIPSRPCTRTSASYRRSL